MVLFSPQVCELDIIFNFEKAYFILDEFLMGGEIQETSKQIVNRSIEASDMLQEVRRSGAPHNNTKWLATVARVRSICFFLFFFAARESLTNSSHEGSQMQHRYF